MATKSTSVNLQPGIIDELDKRGQRSPIINRDLDRLYSLYARALRRVNLSVNEACLITDVCNGTLYDVPTVSMLWGSVQDGIEMDRLDEKWEVDCKALVEKLAALDEFTCMAIVDAAERYWNTYESYPSVEEGVAAVFGIKE